MELIELVSRELNFWKKKVSLEDLTFHGSHQLCACHEILNDDNDDGFDDNDDNDNSSPHHHCYSCKYFSVALA